MMGTSSNLLNIDFFFIGLVLVINMIEKHMKKKKTKSSAITTCTLSERSKLEELGIFLEDEDIVK